MKVTNHTPSQAEALAQSKATEKSDKAKATGKGIDATRTGAAAGARENVQISEQARMMQRANEIANSVPDFRADKVAALKQSIQNGTYKVDAREIADRLVDEHLKDFDKNPA